MKIRFSMNEFEAVTMTSEEFKKIKSNKDTPSFVYLADKNVAYHNDYTCLQSYRYGGNCNCISHPSKHWIEFNPHTGMAV